MLFITLSSVALAAKAAKIIAKKGPGGFSANGFGKKTATLSPTVKLNTGADIPMLGFGTYRTGGPELQVALRHAIAAGYRHLDTASCYNNEAIVGAALKESGLPRESFFITTKLWCTDHGTERTRKAIKASLENLGTGYIDLYLIHAPWQLDIAKSPEEVSMLRRESWRVMEEFHRDGVLRALGVSNFEPRHIDDILACAGVKPAVNQVERHAYLAQTELREYCARHEILLEAMARLAPRGCLRTPSYVRSRPRTAARRRRSHSSTPSNAASSCWRNRSPRSASLRMPSCSTSSSPKRISRSSKRWTVGSAATGITATRRECRDTCRRATYFVSNRMCAPPRIASIAISEKAT